MRTNELENLFLVMLMAIGLVGCGSSYGKIEGRVIDSYTQDPVAGVTVSLENTTLSTSTDSKGQYRIRQVVPGQQILVFRKDHYSDPATLSVASAAGTVTAVQDIEMYCIAAEAGPVYQNTILGTIVDHYTKEALSEVTVTLETSLRRTGEEETDSKGRFSFENLLPKEKCRIAFSKENYGWAMHEGDAKIVHMYKSQPKEIALEVALEDAVNQRYELTGELVCVDGEGTTRYGCAVRGRLSHYKTGELMANADVRARGRHMGRELTARTNAEGEFLLHGILPGDWIQVLLKEPERDTYTECPPIYIDAKLNETTDVGQLNLLWLDRFCVPGDGTVLDTMSGLMWVRDPSLCGEGFGSPGKPASVGYTYVEEGAALCEGLSYAGHTDWRLPTVEELKALPSVSATPSGLFAWGSGRKRYLYLSSDVHWYGRDPYGVYMNTGKTSYGARPFVRPVRSTN